MSAPRLSAVAFHLFLLLTPGTAVRTSIQNSFFSETSGTKSASEKSAGAVEKVSAGDEECSVVSLDVKGLAKTFPEDRSWEGATWPCLLRGGAVEIACKMEPGPCGAPVEGHAEEPCCFHESAIGGDWGTELVSFGATVVQGVQDVSAQAVAGLQALFDPPSKDELRAAIDTFATRFNTEVSGDAAGHASIVAELTSKLEQPWDKITSLEKKFYVSYLNHVGFEQGPLPSLLQVTEAESNQQLSDAKEPFTIFMILVAAVAAVIYSKQQTTEQRTSMLYARNLGNCDVWRGLGLTKLLRSSNC